MCGIVGMFNLGKSNVSEKIKYATHAVNSRGQDACGIAIQEFSGNTKMHKDLGLASQVLSDEIIQKFQGYAAITQVRYSTQGANNVQNSQPMHDQTSDGQDIYLVHNGDITNSNIIKKQLINKGVKFECTSDTEVIIKLLTYYYKGDMIDAIKNVCKKIIGAYSLIILAEKKLYAVRDKKAIRPLLLGVVGNTYILASEPYAFTILNGETIRDLHAGEIICIDENGYSSTHLGSEQLSTCAFEYVYISHSSSIIDGKSVFESRYEAGRRLAQYVPYADLIIPIPETGIFAATGLHQQTGIPYAHAILKNRYSLRTFIQPNQELRDEGIRMKLIPLESLIEGKDVILVDDSIVRGSTSKKITSMVRSCAAKKVHFAIASPPLRHPCYWGVDMKTDKDFIALEKNREQIAEEIGADSVNYISINDLCESIGRKQEDLCLSCFNGKKPTEIFKNNCEFEL